MSPRSGLDKAIVIQTAAALVNAEGVEALTLGRLARELGVQTPSLYNHIDGLPGLQRELALLNARQLGEHLGGAAVGKSGPQALRSVAEAFRAYIKENPGVYLSSLRASLKRTPVDAELGQAEARVVEIVLAALASYDLDREDAIHAIRGLRSLVHGFTTLEIAGGFGIPLDLDESFQRLVELLIRGLGQSK